MLNYTWVFWYIAIVTVMQIMTRPHQQGWGYRFTALALVILFAVFFGWVGSIIG